MKILNYREGFASNSSSTHSVWFGEGADRVMEELVDNFCYGWQNFALKSKEEITHYIMTQYKNNLFTGEYTDGVDGYKFKYVKSVLASVFGIEPPDELVLEGAVDHQSRLFIPREQNSNGIDIPSPRFTQELLESLTRNSNTVIYGGNDNGDDINVGSRLTRRKDIDSITDLYDGSNIFCRKDGEAWVIFWKDSGRKLRLSFHENAIYTKAIVPELVDLIISNQCDKHCWYCYRGCNKDGNIAKVGVVESVLDDLREMGVLEVAIGGGDILSYPEIGRLCSTAKYMNTNYDIAINTTLYAPMFSDVNTTNLIRTIIDSFSGVAFSIGCCEDVLRVLTRYADDFDDDTKRKISFQTIPELYTDPRELKRVRDLVSRIGFRLVYLGLKETGRAANIPQWRLGHIKEMRDKFEEWIKVNGWNPIGIDTQFVKNFPQIKDMDGQNFKWMVTEHEGKFSCCIDLPNKKMSESSYSGELFDIHPDTFSFDEEFLEIFSKF